MSVVSHWLRVLPALLVVAACSASVRTKEKSKDPSTSSPHLESDSVTASWGAEVAMSPDAARMQLEPGEYWKVDYKDIKEARAAFQAKVREHCEKHVPNLAEDLSRYNCQYVGVTERMGRFIRITCMCRVPNDWETRYVQAIEGGICYIEGSTEIQPSTPMRVDWVHVHDSLGVQLCPDFYDPK